MNKETRTYLYAFLSRLFADVLDSNYLHELKQNKELLLMIGDDSFQWFQKEEIQTIQEQLNIDFSTILLMNAKPIETSVIDAKDEILIGLQNPVMQFYFQHNFELNLGASHLQTPDHLAIELAFMQNLISRNEQTVQKEFLEKHLLQWVIPYFIGIKSMCTTPLYSDICDFTIEFLASDYEYLCEEDKAL